MYLYKAMPDSMNLAPGQISTTILRTALVSPLFIAHLTYTPEIWQTAGGNLRRIWVYKIIITKMEQVANYDHIKPI